ncbi:MAG: dCMP deaminase family protein [Phycisphaerales bacterium]|nr:dCMP deaminase family protein [Phycisphaerales bacterium]
MTHERTDRWHLRFLDLAGRIATWSKDPSRGVGAVIVSPTKQILSTGFNGLPQGIADHPERLERPTKYDLVCHAELNAILQCARNGVSPQGCTLYSTFSPCVQCALAVIQAGIAEVVTYEVAGGDEHWQRSLALARELFDEAGVCYRTFAASVPSSK